MDDQKNRFGFTYGTLPVHPEQGEESFAIVIAPDGIVTVEITAVSRSRHPYRRCSTEYCGQNNPVHLRRRTAPQQREQPHPPSCLTGFTEFACHSRSTTIMCGKVSMLTKINVIGTIKSVWPRNSALLISIASAAIDTALRGAAMQDVEQGAIGKPITRRRLGECGRSAAVGSVTGHAGPGH